MWSSYYLGGDAMAYIGVQRQTDSSFFDVAEYSIANGAFIDFNTNLQNFAGTDTTTL